MLDDKIGRFLHDRRQIFVGRFYWQTKSVNFIDRLTSPLHLFHARTGAACVYWRVNSTDAVKRNQPADS